jgi:hypothetical protein
MMFPDSEHIQTHLIRKFDPLDQVADTIRSAGFSAPRLVSELCGETVNADLQLPVLSSRVRSCLARPDFARSLPVTRS